MLKKILRHIKQKTLLLAICNKLLKREKKIPWQLKRNTPLKFSLIKPILEEMQVKSVIDIGCNARVITRLVGSSGFFSVGIDKNLSLQGIKMPLEKACLGNIELNEGLIERLPVFDAILLLSVHHQLIKKYGDKWTSNFVADLSKKAKKVIFLEFAALNKKYSDNNFDLFFDNDENSIIKYSYDWLKTVLLDFSISYVGKSPESEVEPYRFMFACRRKNIRMNN